MVPTQKLQGPEKIIIYILLFAFLVIPIISIFKISVHCLENGTKQFEIQYQQYINETYSKNNSDEDEFEQFNINNNNLNKTKNSDYNQYLQTIKHFDMYFYIKLGAEIVLSAVDFLMIIFLISADCGQKLIIKCCTCCYCFANYAQGCINCFYKNSLFNPLTIQSIISLFLFIMSIFLVTSINKAKSQFNRLIENIKEKNSRNNIENSNIIIGDPVDYLYKYKKGLIIFLILYLLLVLANIAFTILRKVYFSKKLSLPPTVDSNNTDTQTNNSKSEMNRGDNNNNIFK